MGLPTVPASDVKKRGWRGLMRQLADQGALIVTNHDEPEAVIVPVDEYQRFVELSEQARKQDALALDGLRRDFDQRLASLRSPGAGDRLRDVVGSPAKLRGKVKAGSSF